MSRERGALQEVHMRPLNADRLAAAMMLRGLTHAELAEKAGISQAAVTNAVKGGRVRPSTLRKIAAALVETPIVDGADLIAGDAA
jgi:transcriptional regulator with XRE-family HTH domain